MRRPLDRPTAFAFVAVDWLAWDRVGRHASIRPQRRRRSADVWWQCVWEIPVSPVWWRTVSHVAVAIVATAAIVRVRFAVAPMRAPPVGLDSVISPA